MRCAVARHVRLCQVARERRIFVACPTRADNSMAIAVVRLGTPRAADEGLRLGTVRRPPRGVPKADFAKLDYYDLWLPALSPSQALVTVALQARDERTWKTFERKYRAEMNKPDVGKLLELLGRAVASDELLGRLLLRGRDALSSLHPSRRC